MLIIAMLAIASQGKAQVSSDSLKTEKNIIKTDIAGLLLSTNYHLNASWEHLLSKKASIETGFYFYKPDDVINFRDFELGAEMMYRKYFNRNNSQMKGFYLAPYTQFRWKYRNYDGYYYHLYNYDNIYIDAGLQTGYQWVIKKKWTIDFYLKAGINLFNNKPVYTNNYYYHSNPVDIIWGGGLKIGYKF